MNPNAVIGHGRDGITLSISETTNPNHGSTYQGDTMVPSSFALVEVLMMVNGKIPLEKTVTALKLKLVVDNTLPTVGAIERTE